MPDDEKLKSLRHSAQISELKYIASKDELYLFSEEDFLQYKKIMGGSAKVDEVESLYSELAEAKAKKLIAKEDISGARVQVNNIKKISPTSKKIAPLTDQISSLEDKLKPKEATEDMTKKNAVQPSLSTLQPSGNAGDGLSKVVGKVGSLIYLANGKTFAIERPTMLHVDGQIYPKGSGNPDYIQIGYRCRFTGTEFEVAEVFCER